MCTCVWAFQLESKLGDAWNSIQTVSAAFESAALPVFDTISDDGFANADLSSMINDNMTRGLHWAVFKNSDYKVLEFVYTGCVRVSSLNSSRCGLIPAQLIIGSRMGKRLPTWLSGSQ